MKKRHAPTASHLALAGIFAILVAGAISFPGSTPITGQILNTTVTITFNSIPTDGSLYVDDVYKGKTPISVSLDAGRHRVRATKTGYYDFAGNPVFNKSGTYHMTLNPRPGGEQIAAVAAPPGGALKEAAAKLAIGDLTFPPLGKAAKWRAIITGPWSETDARGVSSYFLSYGITINVVNLGSPVKICWAYLNHNATILYNGCTFSNVERYYTDSSPSAQDNNCAYDTMVPCSGYLVIYSQDKTQPILPGGTFCASQRGDNPKKFCMPLQFVRESDLIG